MKTLTFILILATICGVTHCFDSSEEYDTPQGPMNIRDLLHIYYKYRHHKYDFAVPDSIKLVSEWIQKTYDVVYSRESPNEFRRNYHDFKVFLESLLSDLYDERAIQKCGFVTVAEHHMRAMQSFANNCENHTVKNLCVNFMDEFRNIAKETENDADFAVYIFMQIDTELWAKVSELGKLRPRCCKFVSDYSLIRGQC